MTEKIWLGEILNELEQQQMDKDCLRCVYSDFIQGEDGLICKAFTVPFILDFEYIWQGCDKFKSEFSISAEEAIRFPLRIKGGYPDRPEEVIIKKNRFIPKSLTKGDIWEYYDKVKKQIIPFFKNKDAFLGIVVESGKKVFKRYPSPKAKEYITINNVEDFDKYNTGRTVEFYIAERDKTDVAIIDSDPGENVTFNSMKEHTLLAYDIMVDLEMIAEVEILYTGKRGFHLWGWLHRRRNIDDVRQELWDALEKGFEGEEHITITKKPKKGQIRMDISINKTAGVHIAPLSIRVETGLVAFWVPKNRMMSFEKTMHTTDKILYKLK